MADEQRYSELLRIASALRRMADDPRIDTPANRLARRAVVQQYLKALKQLLTDEYPAEALEPIEFLIEQLDAIDGFGVDPPLFQGGGVHTKPIRRLQAEGHAVGCAAYCHEVVGLKIGDACKGVASLFSYLGHAGRTAEGKVGDGRRLSSKTLYQWYNELDAKPDDADLAWAVRWAAKLTAIDALRDAERRNPTCHLPQEEARTKLAERMGNIAVGTLIGAPSGPSWRLDTNISE